MRIALLLILILPLEAVSQQINWNDSLNTAITQYDEGQLKNSYNILLGMVRNKVEKAEVFYYMSLIMIDSNSPENADLFLKQSIKLDPEFSKSYSELAYLKITQGVYDSAEYFAKKAISLNQKEAKPYINLATALIYQGKDDEGAIQIKNAAKIDPNYVSGLGSSMLVNQNNLSGAIYYFKVVEEVDPTNLFNCMNFGNALWADGKVQEALRILKIGYTNSEQNQEYFGVVYSLYFRALFDLGDYEAILKDVSSKVDRNYEHQYFFKALYYQLQNNLDFQINAKKYFDLTDEPEPKSLEEWAINKAGNIR